MTSPLPPEVKSRRVYERKFIRDEKKYPQYYRNASGWNPTERGFVKCRHCERGWRTIISDCVVCGCGPAPARWIDELPKTDAEIDEALARLGSRRYN